MFNKRKLRHLFYVLFPVLLSIPAISTPVLFKNNTPIVNDYNANTFSQTPNVQNVTNFTDIEFSEQSSGASESKFAIIKDPINGDRLYGWGNNSSGQLGLQSTSNKVLTPTLINIPGLPPKAKISKVVSGLDLSAVVINDKDLYFSGSNYTGAFGNGETNLTKITTFTKNPYFCTGGKYEGIIESIAITGSTTGDVAGSTTGVVIKDKFNNKKLYTFGSNITGQLGDGGIENYRPEPLDLTPRLKGNIIGKILASSWWDEYSFSILTTDGLYGWGANDSGVLGLGNDRGDHIFVPTKAPKITGNVQAHYTDLNNFILMDNVLYVAGRNTMGSSGLGLGLNSVADFTPITNPPWDQERVKDIQFAYAVTFVLTDNSLYVAGDNTEGLLGQGKNSSIKPNSENFIKIDSLDGKINKNSKLVTSRYFAMLINENEVFGWGRKSTLGTGETTNDSEKILKPEPIDTFGQPSTLYSKDNNNIDPDFALNDFYDKTTSTFDPTKLQQYVKFQNIPQASHLTLKAGTEPVLNKNKTISLSLTADYAFNSDWMKTWNFDLDIVIGNFAKITEVYKKDNYPKKVVVDQWLNSVKNEIGGFDRTKLEEYLFMKDVPIISTFRIDVLLINKANVEFNLFINGYFDEDSNQHFDESPKFNFTLTLLPRVTNIELKTDYPSNIPVNHFYYLMFKGNELRLEDFKEYADFTQTIGDAKYILVDDSYNANLETGVVEFDITPSIYYDVYGDEVTDQKKVFNFKLQLLPVNTNDELLPWWTWLVLGILGAVLIALSVAVIIVKRQNNTRMVMLYRRKRG